MTDSSAAGPPPRRRRGRKPADAAATPAARELRRRREQLGLSIRAAAARAGVSHTVIVEIEQGRRLPNVGTYERLRQGLGLDAPASVLVRPPEPAEITEVHLARLCACLWACGGRISLGDLATALGLMTAAVREQLPAATERLAACGVVVTCDGTTAVLGPVHAATAPVAALRRLVTEQRRAVLTSETLTVLAYLAWFGGGTRRAIEDFRGEDSETLVGRLVDTGLLAVSDRKAGPGRPNLYVLTEAALRAMSVASTEELREVLRPMIEPALARLHPDRALALGLPDVEAGPVEAISDPRSAGPF